MNCQCNETPWACGAQTDHPSGLCDNCRQHQPKEGDDTRFAGRPDLLRGGWHREWWRDDDLTPTESDNVPRWMDHMGEWHEGTPPE